MKKKGELCMTVYCVRNIIIIMIRPLRLWDLWISILKHVSFTVMIYTYSK